MANGIIRRNNSILGPDTSYLYDTTSDVPHISFPKTISNLSWAEKEEIKSQYFKNISTRGSVEANPSSIHDPDTKTNQEVIETTSEEDGYLVEGDEPVLTGTNVTFNEETGYVVNGEDPNLIAGILKRNGSDELSPEVLAQFGIHLNNNNTYSSGKQSREDAVKEALLKEKTKNTQMDKRNIYQQAMDDRFDNL